MIAERLLVTTLFLVIAYECFVFHDIEPNTEHLHAMCLNEPTYPARAIVAALNRRNFTYGLPQFFGDRSCYIVYKNTIYRNPVIQHAHGKTKAYNIPTPVGKFAYSSAPNDIVFFANDERKHLQNEEAALVHFLVSTLYE